jgi:hypothetical protein
MIGEESQINNPKDVPGIMDPIPYHEHQFVESTSFGTEIRYCKAPNCDYAEAKGLGGWTEIP